MGIPSPPATRNSPWDQESGAQLQGNGDSHLLSFYLFSFFSYLFILMYLLVLSLDAVNSHRTYSDSHISRSHSSISLSYSSRLQQRLTTALANSTHLQHAPTTRLQHSSLTYITCLRHSPTHASTAARAYSTALQHSPTAPLPYSTRL